jgi:hypothetical protein
LYVYDINQFMNILTRGDSEAALDLRRLRHLTENFGGLQGLNFAFIGALFLLTAMEEVYGASWPLRGGWQWVIWAAVIGAMWYTPRYYLQRFGYVEPRNPSNKQVAIFVLVLLIFFFSTAALPVMPMT